MKTKPKTRPVPVVYTFPNDKSAAAFFLKRCDRLGTENKRAKKWIVVKDLTARCQAFAKKHGIKIRPQPSP